MNSLDDMELRQNIAQLANDMDEMRQRIMKLTQKYRWQTQRLTQNLAGQILSIASNELADTYQKIYELDHIFSDQS